MLVQHEQLRQMLHIDFRERTTQGHDTSPLADELENLPDSYDAMMAFAEKLAATPMRDDWPYDEPDDLPGIFAAAGADKLAEPIGKISADDAAKRVRAGFIGSVCGCQLGKPVEVMPTLAELREALEATGDWPLNDYFSVETLEKLGRKHPSWTSTTRGNQSFAASDDDMNYTVMGAMLLHRHGLDFTKANVRDLWISNLPSSCAWGPERTLLVKAAQLTFGDQKTFNKAGEEDFVRWVNVLNPGSELCGAQIRADAYGYACPGRPKLAAELAWRDASFTHRRTGVYSTMYTAAAIAMAMVTDDPLEVFETALHVVPRRSRFAEITERCLNMVGDADDWLDGYQRIHDAFGEHGHCLVYQETGTLMNTLRFAESVGHGFCLQVMQGNDTDSYGATAGSLLGCFFGPGHLEDRWVTPLKDTIHTTIGGFHNQSLSSVADWMAELPKLTVDGK